MCTANQTQQWKGGERTSLRGTQKQGESCSNGNYLQAGKLQRMCQRNGRDYPNHYNKTDPTAVDRRRKWAGLQWDCPENKKGVVYFGDDWNGSCSRSKNWEWAKGPSRVLSLVEARYTAHAFTNTGRIFTSPRRAVRSRQFRAMPLGRTAFEDGHPAAAWSGSWNTSAMIARTSPARRQ